MLEVKLVVIYPKPVDVEDFEEVYVREHIPLALKRLTGVTRAVATKFVAVAGSDTPFHRMAEIYFKSAEALEACVSSPGGQETMAHAVSISTGGPPIVLIAEEEPFSAKPK